jgi:response regulator RpfG family c-di-GMP phosphodiesterase
MSKVLVVDDEKSIRVTLAHFLQDKGYEAAMTEDFSTAMELFQQDAFDVVVTDIIMPRYTGVDILQQIRAINPGVPVIMMTGEPNLETSVEALKAGAYDYLSKPIEINELYNSVEKAAAYKKIYDEKLQLELENKKYMDNLENLVNERTTELRQSMINTALATASMLDMRDPYTAGHQKRVGILAKEIGLKMGLTKDQAEGLNLIGGIHDIGKITVPSEILTKPTKLSFYEYEIIKEHSEKGYNILAPFKMPWPVAEVVYQHHERLDGSGYPRGLMSADISMDSRIVAAADVVEAMMSHRPYRPALGLDAALNEILAHRGIKFDNEVVDACVSLFREDKFVLIPAAGGM